MVTSEREPKILFCDGKSLEYVEQGSDSACFLKDHCDYYHNIQEAKSKQED